MAENINRRNFIITLMAISGFSAVGGAYYFKRGTTSSEIHAKLNELTSSYYLKQIEDNTWFIGKEYVQNIAPSLTIDDVTNELSILWDDDLNKYEKTVQKLRDMVQDDFDKGRTGQLHNVVLTKTELNLCAFVFLSAK